MIGKLLIWLTILVLQIAVVSADEPLYRAGILRLTVQDIEPFDATVWYPTRAAEERLQLGPFTVFAARDAAIADTRRFPVVLLSHGRRGSPLGHRELSARLAREGFIVVAPTHLGDASGQSSPRPQRQILEDRPRQARLAFERVLADRRFAQQIDGARLGAVGFSAGGYTVLALAGARVNLDRARAYCRENPQDIGSCGAASPGDGAASPETPVLPLAAEPGLRLKAMVLMDPLAIMFDAQGLASLQMPILLMLPENDAYMGNTGNARALASVLRPAPAERVVPGSHFVFIEPCPPAVAEAAAMLCKDAPDVDRHAVHRQIQEAVVDFLRRTL